MRFIKGTKVQCRDKYGYFIPNVCGHVVEINGNDAIIKAFDDNLHYSTVSVNNIATIEII